MSIISDFMSVHNFRVQVPVIFNIKLLEIYNAIYSIVGFGLASYNVIYFMRIIMVLFILYILYLYTSSLINEILKSETATTLIMVIMMRVLRFSCGEVTPSGGVQGIGTVGLLSNSLPSMLLMMMIMMIMILIDHDDDYDDNDDDHDDDDTY